jgi:hypothetical protein
MVSIPIAMPTISSIRLTPRWARSQRMEFFERFVPAGVDLKAQTAIFFDSILRS